MSRHRPCEVREFRSVTTGRWVVRAFTAVERGYRTQADAAHARVRQDRQRRVDLVIY